MNTRRDAATGSVDVKWGINGNVGWMFCVVFSQVKMSGL